MCAMAVRLADNAAIELLHKLLLENYMVTPDTLAMTLCAYADAAPSGVLADAITSTGWT